MSHIPKVVFRWPYGEYEYVFDWPVGTDEERREAITGLPKHWLNTNPHLQLYEIREDIWNYHSGVDLNLNYPTHNMDWHHPVKSIGNGLILYAGAGGGTWGNIMDVFYPHKRYGFIVARFAHVSWFLPEEGIKQPQMNDYVRVGQPLCKIGNIKDAYGKIYAHLHWDMSAPGLDTLIETPNQWCGANRQCVVENYIDPIKFIVEQKKDQVPIPAPPKPEEPPVTQTDYYVNNTSPGYTSVNIRNWHDAQAGILTTLQNGTKVIGFDHTRQRDGYTWRLVQIVYQGETVSGWCVADKLTTKQPTTPP